MSHFTHTRPFSSLRPHLKCTFASCSSRAEYNMVSRGHRVPLCRRHLQLIVTPEMHVEPVEARVSVTPVNCMRLVG